MVPQQRHFLQSTGPMQAGHQYQVILDGTGQSPPTFVQVPVNGPRLVQQQPQPQQQLAPSNNPQIQFHTLTNAAQGGNGNGGQQQLNTMNRQQNQFNPIRMNPDYSLVQLQPAASLQELQHQLQQHQHSQQQQHQGSIQTIKIESPTSLCSLQQLGSGLNHQGATSTKFVLHSMPVVSVGDGGTSPALIQLNASSQRTTLQPQASLQHQQNTSPSIALPSGSIILSSSFLSPASKSSTNQVPSGAPGTVVTSTTNIAIPLTMLTSVGGGGGGVSVDNKSLGSKSSLSLKPVTMNNARADQQDAAELTAIVKQVKQVATKSSQRNRSSAKQSVAAEAAATASATLGNGKLDPKNVIEFTNSFPHSSQNGSSWWLHSSCAASLQRSNQTLQMFVV